MKYFALFSALSLMLMVGCSGERAGEKNETETASITVASMMCEMCVQNVKNAINKLDGVQNVSVKLDEKVAVVEFVPAKLQLSAIETAIAQAGYDANDQKADPDAYEALPRCCKKDG